MVPPVKLPGVRLARDADLSLDPLLHPAAAFVVELRQATTYRVNAAARGACVHLELRQNATASAADLTTSDGCSGYPVYTPGPGRGQAIPPRRKHVRRACREDPRGDPPDRDR